MLEKGEGAYLKHTTEVFEEYWKIINEKYGLHISADTLVLCASNLTTAHFTNKRIDELERTLNTIGDTIDGIRNER